MGSATSHAAEGLEKWLAIHYSKRKSPLLSDEKCIVPIILDRFYYTDYRWIRREILQARCTGNASLFWPGDIGFTSGPKTEKVNIRKWQFPHHCNPLYLGKLVPLMEILILSQQNTSFILQIHSRRRAHTRHKNVNFTPIWVEWVLAKALPFSFSEWFFLGTTSCEYGVHRFMNSHSHATFNKCRWCLISFPYAYRQHVYASWQTVNRVFSIW